MQILNKIVVGSYALLVLGLLFPTSVALAEEGGTGHVGPGGVATLIDAAPVQPGWALEPIYVNYNGSFSRTRDIPIGGIESLGLDVDVDVLTLGALYTTENTVWGGAYYSLGAFVPYSWMDVEGNVNDLQVQDSVQGVGDVTLIPAMLAWTDESWQYTASLSLYAPTGDYNAGDLANLGLNYWTVDPVLSVAYGDPDTGFFFGSFMGVTFNTENSATDYKSGSMFHLEVSMQQLFSLGPGYMGLGVDGFYFKQVSGDSGAGAKRDFKGQVMGIGPVLSYSLPAGDHSWEFEAKWLPESNVENRLKGDYFWVKMVLSF